MFEHKKLNACENHVRQPGGSSVHLLNCIMNGVCQALKCVADVCHDVAYGTDGQHMLSHKPVRSHAVIKQAESVLPNMSIQILASNKLTYIAQWNCRQRTVVTC